MKVRSASVLSLLCFIGLGTQSLLAVEPAATPEDNPSGNAGTLKAQIQTAGSYDAHSGNATRSVTDLHLPGALGVYGLDFTRYWNSTHNDYDDSSAEWSQDFGMSGWSHSWHWKAEYTTYSEEIGSNGENEIFFTTITITFPDGHSSKYRVVRSRNGLGLPPPFIIHQGDPRLGPPYTSEEITSSWPDGGLGVEDHIYQMAADGSSFWLARADGGSVRFIWVHPEGGQGYYLATEVFDPHGLKTELQYTTDGFLWRVLQEGGRYLNITWGYFLGGLRAITRVESGGGGGAPQYVTYSYRQLDPVNHAFLVLAKVGYPNDQGPGQSSSAVYSYGFDYAPGVEAQSPYPLLKFADDPRYGGPMTKIRYDYDYDHGGCLPPADPLLDPDYFSAQPYSIAAEKSGDTDVPPVSRFFLLCAGGIRVEYNGLGGWRKFFFGHSAGTFEEASVAAGGPFKCRTYQLGKVTDFTSAPGAPALPPNLPNQQQNFSFGHPRHSWDGRSIQTESFYSDGSGSPTEVRYADQSVEFYNRTDSSGSDPRDETWIPNPNHHWLFSKTDERNQTTYYRRDARRRVKRIDYPDMSFEEFTYNDFNQVLTHTLPSGAIEHYDYDGFQRLSRAWNSIDGEAQSTDYGYDTLERVWTAQNARARANNKAFSARMTYNGRHQVLSVEYPGTGGAEYPTVTYEYDKYGNCTAITDELGHRRVYTYDFYRRCTSYTEPLNAPGWNGSSTVASRRWDWIYDRIIGGTQYGPSSHTSKDWRVQVEPAFNEAGERRMAARNFDVNNRIISEETGWIQSGQLPLGNWGQGPNFETHFFTYDENGQKSSFKDPLGRITNYTYNNRNWLEKTIEHPIPGNTSPPRTTETHYNTAGDKTLVIFPDGKTQQWPDSGYDAFGQPHVFIDERNHATHLTYCWGPMKKLYTVTTHRERDGGGWEDQPTTFGYDLMGRPKQTLFPDGSDEFSVYEFGQLKSWKTRKGQTKTISYDARGREYAHTWDDGMTSGVTRGWDDANRLLSMTNNISTLDYQYDSAGQVLVEGSTIQGSGGGTSTVRKQLNYCRYPSGEVSQITYPNGSTVVNRFLTARGQLEGVGWGTGSTSYVYYPDGKVNYQARSNSVTTTYGYNGRGMISSISHTNTSNQSLAYREYWRDERDRIVAWKRGVGGPNGMEDGRGDRYRYDPEGQLERAWYRAQNPETENPGDPKRGDEFQYDALGNRAGTNRVASRGVMNFERKNNKLNQYRGWWSYSITNYDEDLGGWGEPGEANGVMMQDGWITASFNALNQPMGMWSPVYSGTGNYMWLGYDPLGRCVKRWVGPLVNGHAPAPSTNPATYFYYDGWNLVQEGSNGSTADRVYVHGGRVDEIVASWAGGEWRHHHYDARGHCILLTDPSGVIREQYDYDAFGLPYFYNAGGVKLGASAQWGNRFLFTGREWLKDLKVYDYRNRMYQPELARFLQPDPKQFEAGDYNLYRYTHNDPVNRIDPFGLFEWAFSADYPMNGPGVVAGRETVERAIKIFQATERGSELQKMAPGKVVVVRPTSGNQLTGRKGDDLYLNPRDSLFSDPKTKADSHTVPANETPPETDRGRAVIIGHEAGHLVVPGNDGRDPSRKNPDGRNVQKNENPIRRELGLLDRRTYGRWPIRP